MHNITLSGQPRTGYALFNNIVHKILLSSNKLTANKSQEKAKNIFKSAGQSLYNSYLYALKNHGYNEEKIIINGEFKTICGGPQWFDKNGQLYVRKYIGIAGIGDILITHKIPNELMHFYDTIHSHENPSSILKLNESSNKFATIRNPLGIFNSANHSINALSSEYLQRFRPNLKQSEVREEMSICKFSDMKLCRALLKHQKKYWDEFIPISDNFINIKWEDLISYPNKVIRKICEHLNIELSDDEINAIWNSMGHKNTMIYHQHNYRSKKGVMGDWRYNLTNEHIDLFKSLGFDNIIKNLGYPPLEYFNEKKYTKKQKLIAKNIKSKIIPKIEDKDFATFCFNKSNIDASNYDFYSGQWINDTKIERATFIDEPLMGSLVEKANMELKRVFETARSDYKSDNLVALNRLKENIKSKIKKGHKIGFWGASYDFINIINELKINVKDNNISIFDQLEAGIIYQGKKIKSTQSLKSFDGTIIATPLHDQAVTSMNNFAKNQGFYSRLLTIKDFQ